MVCTSNQQAQRAYLKRMGISMAVYIAALFTGEYLVGRELVDRPVVWLLGLLPGLAIVGAFYAIGKLITETPDEFIRMLIVRQTLVATGFALSLATIWGFLENFELVPHVDAYWVAILWFLGFGIGAVSNRITYGAWGQLR
ncbi:hypothetical protein GRI44_11380 [Altererythrobacter confluentis]|uniref:Uncharacterized protein n=1 Tax=Allopontixanthobacter confluentis TaxID=1849021 RepID=A0A6L7GIF9_9SPHN|nr:hypothetical protein [Allopontixanthobacter confluentis]MXP15350.1 hypothetical protein [Allopontixanthobacter confluentis]